MKDLILVVDDDRATVEMLSLMLEAQGYEVLGAHDAEQAMELLHANRVSLVISDIKMPRMDGIQFLSRVKAAFPDTEVIMMTAFVSVESAIEAMRRGAYDYLTKPITDMSRTNLVIAKALEKSRVQKENTYLRKELELEHGFGSIIGKSPAMRDVYSLIRKVAATDASVLIEGESGTGKELVARAVHFNSAVRERRFVPVDCGLISATLLESELFGHARGAFTGASAERRGLIEEADGGTLFLDEIADTDPAFQAKLLRVVQEREIRRLGESRARKVNIRLITATNRPLEPAVDEGRFRKDLYYRIKIIHIKLPPLRKRQEDIMLLAENFLKRFCRANRKTIRGFAPEAARALYAHQWPGNVRELLNAVEHAATLCMGGQIGAADLPDDLTAAARTNSAPPPGPHCGPGMKFKQAKADFERRYIKDLLDRNGGNISRAAQESGIVRQNLQKKIKTLEIRPNASSSD